MAGNPTLDTRVQDQFSNHCAKEWTLKQLSEIDYNLEAMRNLQCVDI